MELSLFSRDTIALSTAVSLSHEMFDAALLLGVCDKIVPGLLIGALSFGHLPVIFVPAGPMTSGLPTETTATSAGFRRRATMVCRSTQQSGPSEGSSERRASPTMIVSAGRARE